MTSDLSQILPLVHQLMKRKLELELGDHQRSCLKLYSRHCFIIIVVHVHLENKGFI